MNIIEKADKYADGKANEAITKAIAQAYLDGYRDGYNDREKGSQAEHFGQKTMRRMVIIFFIFHMRERIIVRFLQRNNGKSC